MLYTIQCAAKPRFRHRAGVLVIKSIAKSSRCSDDEWRVGDELVISHPETICSGLEAQSIDF